MKVSFNIIDSKNHKVVIEDIKYYNNVRAILKAFNKNHTNRYCLAIIKRNDKGEIIKESDWLD